MPTTSTTTKTDVSALAYVLAATQALPELFADHLPGESREERAARREAARDITEDLLTEAAHDLQVEDLAVVEQIVWPSEIQEAAA
jgi:hypothetical protein